MIIILIKRARCETTEMSCRSVLDTSLCMTRLHIEDKPGTRGIFHCDLEHLASRCC